LSEKPIFGDDSWIARKYRRDGTPYPEGDEGLLEWARDLENFEGRVVRQETLPNGYWVSTVWLGLDHNFRPTGPPLIFETMVINPSGEWEDYQERYSTENEAILGHMRAVEEYAKK
jgi:hypothetical protein